MQELRFWKVEAAGNDFIFVRYSDVPAGQDVRELTLFLCHRRFGIGADGTIFIHEAQAYDFEMRYYNADGSGPAMCGNGGRAALCYVHESGLRTQANYTFLASDGEHSGVVDADGVQLTISRPREIRAIALNSETAYQVDTGVPHLVRVCDDLDGLDIDAESPDLRRRYDANINYIRKLQPGVWKIRTWERGVEGETLACGTGATASALVIKERLGGDFPLLFQARGGNLTIDQKNKKLWLAGPVRKVFEGTVVLNR